jgi:inner membrane protein
VDNLCHTLAGATLAEAGLKRTTRSGYATLLIASSLPDIDVLVFATSVPSIVFRRGWTHGVVAQALLPLALAAAVTVVSRQGRARDDDPPLRFGALVALAYLGVYGHVFLDFLNNYGVRLLFPFDRRWFYGDTLFIIDPWMWLVLAAGVWLARRRGTPRPARVAVAMAAIYIAAMLTSVFIGRRVVTDAWTAANGTIPRALMVGPVPLTPLERAIVLDAGDRYVTGRLTWLPLAVRFDADAIPKNDTDPRVAVARAAGMNGFLVWSRFPFWRLEPAGGGTRVSVQDMRFTQRPPWMRFRPGFDASVVVPANGGSLSP